MDAHDEMTGTAEVDLILHALSALDRRPASTPSLTEYFPHGPHGTVHVRGEFGLPSAAFAAADAYRRNWPAEGYGTLISVRHCPESQRWIVEGSRAASCE